MSLNLDYEAWDVNLNAWAPITPFVIVSSLSAVFRAGGY
jgi:hypothetical protein